jgi:2-polyprenyl-6-methoxyphenol hydroxylase-like FAD-dependent oxidoreductase
MAIKKALIVGGGIGGLTSAVAMRGKGVEVDVVEINPHWSVYGVGIIQQANVVRAMAQLGLVDKYLSASFGFDFVRVCDGQGNVLATLPSDRLGGADYPASLGVSRPALHKVLGDSAKAAGADIRLGVTATAFRETPEGVMAACDDGSERLYDLVIGADGLNSRVRELLFGKSYQTRYTGQSVWRHNFRRTPDLECLTACVGPEGNAGLCPLSDDLMYMYVTSEEPGATRFDKADLPRLMRERIARFGGFIGALREQIVDPEEVVYRPMEVILVPRPWHKGRVVLIGDAAHATTPHLGQGAGMAIEDSIVLAEEIAKPGAVEDALQRFGERRWERCKYITERSIQVGEWEMARRHDIDRPAIFKEMFEVTAQPI